MNNYKRYWKGWRLRHTAYRNKERKKYYAQFRKGAFNEGKRWEDEDIDEIIMTEGCSDRILSTRLGRSVQAIQGKRSKVWKAFT